MSASHKGQAWYVIRGYRYQLLQSLDAWLALQPGEILWLETEEDFSVSSNTIEVDTQVKSSAAATGPRSHSLQSADVRAALSRYWERSDQGRDPKSHLNFIAKGNVAREQALTFPNGVGGIDYWMDAVMGGDTGPIRAALAAVFEGESLGKWINANPTDEELRTRLLSRVQWSVRALDEAPLLDLIRDKIAELYLEKGYLVTLADESARSLLDHVAEAASQPNPPDRRLTAVDLHRSLEYAAGPVSALQAAARAVADVPGLTANDLFITRIAAPVGNTADRHSTVMEILTQVRGEAVIWLHGGYGVGKSTLAHLIASEVGGLWWALDLRSVQHDAKAALAAWRELIRAILRDPHIGGVVIDDLAGPALAALRPRLSALATSIAGRGGRIIVTSPFEPSPARLAEIGASPNAAILAPYFSEDDVRSLVTAQNGPANERIEAWTRLIRLSTNGGHPLLVAAKVASLRSRAWPRSALLEDIGAPPSEAVRATREEARRRLVEEIPSPEGRQLLRRLGCLFDRANDPLILALAQDNPPILNGGDALAILRGSWIEVTPGGDLRLSPLIADIGNDVPEQEALQHRRTAAEYWLASRVLDQRTLPLCFWNAFWGKHTWILVKLCEVIETLPHDQIRGAAALLSPMTVLRTDQSIYPEQPVVGTMLRLLQVEVANAIEDNEIAGRAALRLVAEIDQLEIPEIRLLQTSVAIPKILLSEHANIEPAEQLNLALRLRAVLQEIVAMDDENLSAVTARMDAGLPPGVDVAGFLFSALVIRIRSSSRMLQMIESLDQLSEADRNNFIDAAAASFQLGAGSFVHNGWAQEQLDGLDLHPALDRFKRMSEIAQNWHRADIEIQLACARSVILDEGLGDRAAAIGLIDDAIAILGNSPALVRQKGKVLGHAGSEAEAAQLLISVEDTVGADVPFDRALALRDGGVSAAFTDAIRLFRKAHDVLVREGEHPALAVGLQIEVALTLWAMNDRPGAVIALADALDAIEVLDPAASRQNERAHQFARATIGIFWQKLDPYPRNPSLNIPFGQASALAGDEALLGVDLKPLLYNWRILALCEIELGVDAGIERRSMAKQEGAGLISVEMFIAMARYARAVANKDIPSAFRLGRFALAAYDTARKSRIDQTDELLTESDRVENKDIQTLIEEGLADIVRTIPVDLLVWHRLRHEWGTDLVDRIEAACVADWGDATSISDVLSAALGRTFASPPSTSVALAASVASEADFRGNPGARFARDLLLISHSAHSLARRALEPLVVPHMLEGWSTVLRDETFALRAPFQHVPEIEAAIDEMKSSGLRGAARLMLAAAPAVRATLSETWVKFLRLIDGGNSLP